MRKSVFRLDSVSVGTGSAVSLDDFSLELYEGEIMGVVGPSNSGKSALCRVLQGKEQLCAGTLYVQNKPVQGKRMPESAAKRVALIENGLTLAPGLSVAELLAVFNPRRSGRLFLKQKQALAEAKQILAALSIDVAPDAQAGRLSTARQHLIMIAAAWLQRAALIMLDNTVNGYTDQEWERVKQTLLTVAENGTAVLLTSNRESRLIQLCHHIAVFGRRTNLKVFEPERYSVLRAVLAQRKTVGGTAKGAAPAPRAAVFRAEGISTRSLNRSSFVLYGGEITGIYDQNNMAGQELFSALMSMDPAAGRFSLDGVRLSRTEPAALFKKGIGFMPEHAADSQLFPQQSALDNILCASRRKLGGTFLFHRRNLSYLAGSAAGQLGVEKGDLYLRAEQFDSVGRLRIYLSRWGFVKLHVLFCNCPLEPADVETQIELKRFFQMLAAKGTAVCLFGYDRTALLEVCGRLYEVEQERIVEKQTEAMISESSIQKS